MKIIASSQQPVEIPYVHLGYTAAAGDAEKGVGVLLVVISFILVTVAGGIVKLSKTKPITSL